MTTPAPRPAPTPTVRGAAVAPVAAPGAASRRRRYPQLDSYRGIAVVASVVFNVYQFCNINNALYDRSTIYRIINSFDAAIPCLFVIAGFLLFEPIARAAIDGGPPLRTGSFLVRRTVRLVPLYYIAVLVVWFFRQESLPGDWRDLLEHLTFTQVFDAKRIFYTDGPAWAVSALVFYYLTIVVVSPAISLACRRLIRRRRRIVVVSAFPALLVAASLLWKAWSFTEGHRPITGSSTTWYGPIANLDSFAIGMAIAVSVITLRQSRPVSARGRQLLLAATAIIVATAIATRSANPWLSVYFFTICSLGFGCLTAAAVLTPDTGSRAALPQSQYLARLGVISYGIYLWHEPVLLALHSRAGIIHQTPAAFLQDSTVVLALSIAAGWLSYLLIQRPANQLLTIFGSASEPNNQPDPGPDGPAAGRAKGDVTPQSLLKLDQPSFRHLTLLPNTRANSIPEKNPP
jgi:peptidoglycan/LPS O-acetylase OafA/YrhL